MKEKVFAPIFPLLRDDDAFIQLLPLMGEFATLERGLWWVTCDEVIQSIKQPSIYMTILGVWEDKIFAYLTGHRTGLGDVFFITQVLNRDPRASDQFNAAIDERLRNVGISRIEAVTNHVDAFERYGYVAGKVSITKLL